MKKIVKKAFLKMILLKNEILGNLKFQKEKMKFQDLSNNSERGFSREIYKYKCIHDYNKKTSFEPHYTYHLAWAARKLAELNPKSHYDFSSHTYFSTIVSAFIPVKHFEFRPLDIYLSNFSIKHADLLQLPFEDNSLESVSCMHVVEHVGLGRYGDMIDFDGDLKAINELKRIVKIGGKLIFVVPVGVPRIEFNAHRVYSYEQVVSFFDGFDLIEFGLIPDKCPDGIIYDQPHLVSEQVFGCGCFLFQKRNV